VEGVTVSKLRAFTMPKWGIEMTEGTLGEWNVSEGDTVSKGQILAQIESDKIINEVQSEFDGRIVRIIAVSGDSYPVGALLGILEVEPASSEEIETFARRFSSSLTNPTTDATVGAHAAGAPKAAPDTTDARQEEIGKSNPMSPAARLLSKRLGLDPGVIHGSGRNGRISYQDVDQAAKPVRIVAGGTAISILPTGAALNRFYASPIAKRLAVQHNIDLSALEGSGRRGRISRRDVMRAAGVTSLWQRDADVAEVVRMTPMRKAIARQLTAAKSTIPHFYLRSEINFDSLLALRAETKGNAGTAPSLNDYLIKAAAIALTRVPDVNVQVHGDAIHRFRAANVAVAVATDRGLVAPVLRSAESKSLSELSVESLQLARRARAGKLRQEDLEGASFTVSNLGMYGVGQFDAIINPPQAAILAVGSASRRAVEINGKPAFASTAWVSLSCDHRAIDGALGARFLSAVKDLIESPRQL
jgi:pyruvate dehydrogenase E2 component (dihydrolipoamide acetyltransferase)